MLSIVLLWNSLFFVTKALSAEAAPSTSKIMVSKHSKIKGKDQTFEDIFKSEEIQNYIEDERTRQIKVFNYGLKSGWLGKNFEVSRSVNFKAPQRFKLVPSSDTETRIQPFSIPDEHETSSQGSSSNKIQTTTFLFYAAQYFLSHSQPGYKSTDTIKKINLKNLIALLLRIKERLDFNHRALYFALIIIDWLTEGAKNFIHCKNSIVNKGTLFTVDPKNNQFNVNTVEATVLIYSWVIVHRTLNYSDFDYVIQQLKENAKLRFTRNYKREDLEQSKQRILKYLCLEDVKDGSRLFLQPNETLTSSVNPSSSLDPESVKTCQSSETSPPKDLETQHRPCVKNPVNLSSRPNIYNDEQEALQSMSGAESAQAFQNLKIVDKQTKQPGLKEFYPSVGYQTLPNRPVPLCNPSCFNSSVNTPATQLGLPNLTLPSICLNETQMPVYQNMVGPNPPTQVQYYTLNAATANSLHLPNPYSFN